MRLTAASVVRIQVKDAGKVLSQKTRDGRRPELTVGVWGPAGLWYPARVADSLGGAGELQSGVAYELAVPRDTALNLHIASRDLKLGDADGALLAGSASRQTFVHAAGDPKPKSFTFSVLGLLP